MQSKLTAWAVTAVVLGLVVACGSDDAGSQGSGGSAGTGGTAAFDAGGTGGVAGASGAGGGVGATGGSGAGDAGEDAGFICKPAEPDGGAEYKHDVCNRLQMPVPRSDDVIPSYFGAVHADCRVAKLTDEHPALFQFANELIPFSLHLWGCEATGVNYFGLVDAITELTAADAALLIDIYMQQLVLYLELSPKEAAEIRAILECLAKGAITDPSTTHYSLSKCSDGGTEAGDDASTDGQAGDGALPEAGNDGATDATPTDASMTTDGSSMTADSGVATDGGDQ